MERLAEIDFKPFLNVIVDMHMAYIETRDATTKGALAALEAIITEPSDEDDFFERYDAALKAMKD
ncbi:hypothetical protein [Paratractidigestivibacter sp.]|uniref:hypothetical protein n=1 Tax=Paratractidigestivibacter sp. TaxID=2847316 RepID=UPI002ABDF960|nr:hypothetical protein [Paratractidigestivibacter sp.]